MNKTLQLQIPVPCHENWNNMSPEQQGRFCLSCQKTVVDFTTMTDAQILSYFQTASANTCGRFSSDQLNRNLTSTPARKSNWFKYFIHFIIPAVLVASKSYAQGEVKRRPAVCNTPIKPDSTKRFLMGDVDSNKEHQIISGRVLDNYDNPIAGTAVAIKGAKHGTVTDAQGYFKIDAALPAYLIASSVGFETIELKVDQNRTIDIVMVVLNTAILGDILITAVPNRKPLIFHQFKEKISDSLRVSSVKVYPNPLRIQSHLTVEYACKKNGNYTIEIFNVNGKLLQVERVNIESKILRKEIRMNQSLVAGTYIVQIVDPLGKKAASQKVIVVD